MNTNAWGMPVVVGMDGSVPQYDALGLLALQSRGFQMQTWCALQGSQCVWGGGQRGRRSSENGGAGNCYLTMGCSTRESLLPATDLVGTERDR